MMDTIIDYYQKDIDNRLLNPKILTEEDCKTFEKRISVYETLIEISKKLTDFKHYLLTKSYEALYLSLIHI